LLCCDNCTSTLSKPSTTAAVFGVCCVLPKWRDSGVDSSLWRLWLWRR
jgi:hypothetical protein